MDTDPPAKRSHPTWEVHARPLDAPHEPWRVMKISARSPIQAQAKLNRKGYEMALQTALKVLAESDTIEIAKLEAIKCVKCGYELAGLRLESSSVNCPECAYQQPLLVWRRDQPTGIDKNHPVIGIFAVIGAMVVTLIAIPLVFVLLASILSVLL